VIDLVNGTATAGFAFGALAKGGKLIQVGLFGGELMLPLPIMAIRALTVQGSYVGNPKELRELVKLAQDGELPALPVTHHTAEPCLRSADAAARRPGHRPPRTASGGRAMTNAALAPFGGPEAAPARANPAPMTSRSARDAIPEAATGEVVNPHDLAVDRPLHARPAARGTDLRGGDSDR